MALEVQGEAGMALEPGPQPQAQARESQGAARERNLQEPSILWPLAMFGPGEPYLY
jgi:hypothetical protein